MHENEARGKRKPVTIQKSAGDARSNEGSEGEHGSPESGDHSKGGDVGRKSTAGLTGRDALGVAEGGDEERREADANDDERSDDEALAQLQMKAREGTEESEADEGQDTSKGLDE